MFFYSPVVHYRPCAHNGEGSHMKLSNKSALTFLVAWLVILTAGYLLSRERLFAAGGGGGPPPCLACALCQGFEQIKTSVGGIGYTTSLTNTTFVPQAFGGTMCGAANDTYGVEFCEGCPGGGSGTIAYWSVVGASNTCQPASPPPDGIYELQNGTVQIGKGNIANTFCTAN